MSKMDAKLFDKLKELGAGEFAHLNGPLVAHLTGTYELLVNWGNNETLCRAGLYHAVYGTSGYADQLVKLKNRNMIQTLIGEDAENIVYDYCACHREIFWPQIGMNAKPIFKNRFTNDEYSVGIEWLKNFCELTVANELEIAKNSNSFIEEYGTELRSLFMRMKSYLSAAAYTSFCEILGEEVTQ
jgi:hypothetical protein